MDDEKQNTETSTHTQKKKSLSAGIRVLVVDNDLTSLKVIEQMLEETEYEVSKAQDALDILHERECEFDLILSEVHMSETNGFDLIEVVKKEFKIPVVMMSADHQFSTKTRALKCGALFFFPKPIMLQNVWNLWQYVYYDQMECFQPLTQHRRVSKENTESSSSINDENHKQQDCKREKISKKKKKRKENRNQPKSLIPEKKTRVVWTPALHDKFLVAVKKLGISHAFPKRILKLMNVRGLTRANVASHLQKYRLFITKFKDNAPSDDDPLPLCNNTGYPGYAAANDPLMLYKYSQFPPQPRTALLPNRPVLEEDFHVFNTLCSMPRAVPEYRNQATQFNGFTAGTERNMQDQFMRDAFNANQLNIRLNEPLFRNDLIGGGCSRDVDMIMQMVADQQPEETFPNALRADNLNVGSFGDWNQSAGYNIHSGNNSYAGIQMYPGEMVGGSQGGANGCDLQNNANLAAERIDEIEMGNLPSEENENSPGEGAFPSVNEFQPMPLSAVPEAQEGLNDGSRSWLNSQVAGYTNELVSLLFDEGDQYANEEQGSEIGDSADLDLSWFNNNNNNMAGV